MAGEASHDQVKQTSKTEEPIERLVELDKPDVLAKGFVGIGEKYRRAFLEMIDLNNGQNPYKLNKQQLQQRKDQLLDSVNLYTDVLSDLGQNKIIDAVEKEASDYQLQRYKR